MSKSFLLSLLLGLLSYNLSSQSVVEKRIYHTTSISSNATIKIDANIDEPAWETVAWTTDYTENDPDNGTPPSEQTKMKILYDQNNIYVAFRCLDADAEGIVKRLSRRDGFDGDWVEVTFDSYNDDRTAFSFTITAAGVKGDEFISNNGSFDSSWNPIWYVKTKIDDLGWTAELRIPLTQLRFSKDDKQIWGLQSKRKYFRNNERSLWQHIPVNSPGFVSEFGELHGIEGIKAQNQLEIQPYTVLQYDSYEPEANNPFRDGNDTKLTAGLDAKIGLTNDLTLDLTVNPDFGQVDADPGAIALDGFEIFFEERRPFFVENKNIFDYGFGNNQDNLFFSRRIGRTPQGSVSAPNAQFIDRPDNTTILGAAKFSGKTQNGWALGVLESVTAKEYATVLNSNDTEEDVIVEPLTNYFVGRAQKDFNNNNSYIGGIFTATNRDLEPSLNDLHKSAYTAGLDFRHNWNNRTFYLEGAFVGSRVEGTKEAILATQQSITHLFQRVDASHVRVDQDRTSLSGTGGQIGFGKSGGGNWRYNIGGYWRSPELELNDIGFLRRADDIQQYANVTRQFNKPTNWYRRASIRYALNSAYDFEGNYNRMQHEINAFANFKNNWYTEIGAAHKPRIYINSFLRSGPRWRYSEENFFYAFVGTDDRRKFSTEIGYVQSDAKENNFGLRRYSFELRYQPLDALNLSLDTQYEVAPNKTQYVDQQGFNQIKRYILGEIDQNTFSTTLRVDYTINPNFTIQYYGQPFISRGRYSNFNYVKNATAERLSDRVTWYDDNQINFENDNYLVDENTDGITDYQFSKPDFAFVQFRSNLVLRWEYIPGSEVFFVWSQGINSSGDATDTLNSIINNQLFNQRPNNTFLIKATYRFLL